MAAGTQRRGVTLARAVGTVSVERFTYMAASVPRSEKGYKSVIDQSAASRPIREPAPTAASSRGSSTKLVGEVFGCVFSHVVTTSERAAADVGGPDDAISSGSPNGSARSSWPPTARVSDRPTVAGHDGRPRRARDRCRDRHNTPPPSRGRWLIVDGRAILLVGGTLGTIAEEVGCSPSAVRRAADESLLLVDCSPRRGSRDCTIGGPVGA